MRLIYNNYNNISYFLPVEVLRSLIPLNPTLKKIIAVALAIFAIKLWPSFKNKLLQIFLPSAFRKAILQKWVVDSPEGSTTRYFRKTAETDLLNFLNNPQSTQLKLESACLAPPPVEVWEDPAFPTHLQELSLPPQFFNSIPSATLKKFNKLEKLDLRGNTTDSEIEILSQKLTCCPSIKSLAIAFSMTKRLPNNLHTLPCLEDLWLVRLMGLQTLPENIAQCPYLKKLTIGLCENLTHLPPNIVDLPSNCIIYMDFTPLTDVTTERIQQAIATDDYEGPQFIHMSPGALVALDEGLG